MVAELCKYFRVAIGDVDIISNYLPAVISTYIFDTVSFVKNNILLQEKFVSDYEISSPYLMLEFEKALFYDTTISMVVILCLFIL